MASSPSARNGTRNGSRGIPRDRLLSAAAELFARQGYRATSLDDVAEALAIKKASLYHYIRSKDELLHGIYDRILDRIEEAVAPIAGSDLPPDERLRRMIHAHIGVVATECDMLAVLFQEEAELAEANLAEIRRRKRAHERLFERVVDEGIESGRLRPLTGRLVVYALLGMCNWMYQWYRPGRFSPDQIAAEFTLMLESGWMADDDPRRGAWPRAETVEEALAPARDAARRARAELDQISAEIARAAERLHDGLVEQRGVGQR